MQTKIFNTNKIKNLIGLGLFSVLVFALQIALAPKAQAAVYNVSSVTNPAGCELAEAISTVSGTPAGTCAAPDASNTINLATGTYDVSSLGVVAANITGSLTIKGSGLPTETVIDGNLTVPGIQLTGGGTYNLSYLTIQRFKNSASNNPIIQYAGNLNLDHLIVKENDCTFFAEESAPNLACVLFANVASSASTFTLSNSSFTQNTSVFLLALGTVPGEGVLGGNVNATIFNNTFSNNNSSVANFINISSAESATNVYFYNNTLADNLNPLTALPPLSLNIVGPDTPTYSVNLNMRNNILYRNGGSGTGDPTQFLNCPLSAYTPPNNFVSQGGNISDDNTCTANFFTASSDKNNTDPLISAYSIVNGTGVRALLANSPAIENAVDGTPANPSVDQRGVARPQGAIADSGAYEYVYPTPGLPNTGLMNKSNLNILSIIVGILIASGIIAVGLKLKK